MIRTGREGQNGTANADPTTAGLRRVAYNRSCRKLENDPEPADRVVGRGGDGDVKNERNKDRGGDLLDFFVGG